MGSRDIAEAAERVKKRKEILRKPVPMLPDAPENIRLSKKEFITKRKHQNEEALAVEEFKKKFREEKIKEDENGVQEKGKEAVAEEPKKKMGRPKKVE
jgi:hypothetical protein